MSTGRCAEPYVLRVLSPRAYLISHTCTSIEEKIIQRQLSKEGLQNIVDDREQVRPIQPLPRPFLMSQTLSISSRACR